MPLESKRTELRLAGVVAEGIGAAARRNGDLWSVFLSYVPGLAGFLQGTLNVVLETPYSTPPPDQSGVFRIPRAAIPSRPDFPDEGFTFIRVQSIMGVEMDAFIYRPDGTCHPPTVVELMSKCLLRDRFQLKTGDRIHLCVESFGDSPPPPLRGAVAGAVDPTGLGKT